MSSEKKPTVLDQPNFEPLTPISPHEYEGKQVVISADRIVFNAKLQTTQEASSAANTWEGGDIHLFSHNFISLTTNGSIHLNTGRTGDPPDNEQTKNYIALNAPNIFLGLDDNKTYPNEPAILGNKNEEFMQKLLNFVEKIVEKLSSEYRMVGCRGGFTTPQSTVWMAMSAETGEGSIGELRKMLESIKSQHIFIKK